MIMKAESVSSDGVPIDWCERCECAVIHEATLCEDCVADIAISDDEFRGSEQVSVDRYDCCESIRCPYCGKSPNYSEECDDGEEGTFERECGWCEKPFEYTRYISVKYSSRAKEGTS